MLWPLLFGLFLVAVVLIKYLKPWGQRCPQCHTRRENREYPLCPECGWIFEVPGDDDDDDDDDEEEEEEEEEVF